MSKLFSPTLPSTVDVELLIDTIPIKQALFDQNGEKAKKSCDRLMASAKWAKAADSTRVLILSLRGVAYQQLKQHDLAIADYRQALDLDPDNLWLVECESDILRLDHKFPEAKQVLDKLIAKSTRRKESSLLNRSAVNLQIGQHAAGLEDCEAILAVTPNNIQALQNAAVACGALKQFSEAIDYADKILAIDQNHGAALLQRGKAKIGLKQTADGIKDLEAAVQTGYNLSGTAFIIISGALIALKRYDEVFSYCDRAQAELKDKHPAYSHRGLALAGQKKYTEAIAALKSALALATTGKAKAGIHIQMSSVYLKMEDPGSALIECDLALIDDPAYHIAYNNRAFIFAHQGKITEALKEIAIACASPPVLDNTKSTRGVIYYLAGRFDDAKKDFDEVLSQEPKLGESLCYRGAIYQRDGDLDKADEYFARAQAVDFKLPAHSVHKMPGKI